MVGGPVAGFVMGLVGYRRAKRMQRRVLALEIEVDALREAQKIQATPPEPAPGEPVPEADPETETETVPEADPETAAEADPVPETEPVPEADPEPETETAPASQPMAAPAPEAPAAPRRPLARPPRRPVTPERLAVWVGSALGGFLVLLASLFALSVAIERGWMGPSVRVLLGLVAGTALWLGGARLRTHAYTWLPSATSGAAMGVLFGTLYAASGLYHLIPPAAAFGLMAAVAAVALATAVRHRDRFMAWLGLVGGLLVPVLVSTGENRPLALFSYVVVLSGGALVAAGRRGWLDLVLGAGVGAAALHLGWTVKFYAPDQVPAALLAAAALLVPFVAVAARRDTPVWVGRAALLMAAALPLVATPWVIPLDPIFWDPRTGLEVVRPLGGAPQWALVATLLLPLGAAALARRDGGLVAGAAALAPAAILSLAFVVGWADHPDGPMGLVAAGLLAATALPLIWTDRRPDQRLLRLGLPLAAGLLAALVLEQTRPEGPVVLALTGGLTLLGVAAALRGRDPWMLLPVLVGAALTSLTVAEGLSGRPDLVSWVAAGAVLSYGLLATLPLHQRVLRGARHPAVTAALAGPAFFWPLYQCWQASLGDPLVGALPIIEGAAALLGAFVVTRNLKAGADSGLLALFVAVALLGVNAAIPLQLDNAWLTLAWALEGAALARLSHRLRHPFVRGAAVALAGVVATRLLLNPWALEYGDTAGLPILNWTLYTWGVPALAMLATAHWIRPSTGSSAPVGRTWERDLPALLLLGAIAVGFALINVEVSHLFQDQGPVELGGRGLWQGMVRSLSWAAYGVALLGIGLGRDSRLVRLVGFVVVLLATGKVFVVDLWALSGFVRVGSVLGLGLCLLLAAFLFERLVLRQDRDADALRDPDPDPEDR